MHSYSTDSGERTRVPLFIGGAAVTAVWLVQLVLSAADWNPPWFLSAPSILGTFGVFFFAFDRWLWRKRLFRLIGWTVVPDLEGSWAGTAQQTSTADRDAVDVTVEIEQNWSSISIVLTGNDSRSVSTVAGFETKEAGPTRLVYSYFNEPKPGAPQTMEAHPGLARLQLDEDVIEGDYFTGRGRGTHGELKLTRD